MWNIHESKFYRRYVEHKTDKQDSQKMKNGLKRLFGRLTNRPRIDS